MLVSRRMWPLFLIILGLYLYQGLHALDSDPPLPLAGGPMMAEGLNTIDARNHLAGIEETPDNTMLRPLSTWANLLVFRHFGVGLRQARTLTVVLSGLSLIVFFILVGEASGMLTALLASLFMGMHPVFAVYSRMINPEPLTILLILLCILFWRLGVRWRLFIVPAGILLILAAVVEGAPNNVFFLLTAGMATLMIRLQAWKMSWASLTRGRVRLFGATALLAALAWFFLYIRPNDTEYYQVLIPALRLSSWGSIPQNLFISPFAYWGFIRWALVLCLLAIGYFLAFGQSLMGQIARHRPMSETRVWMFSWLVTGPLFMALRADRPLDVLLVLVPPICMAAAEGLVALLSLQRVRKPGIDILVALGMMALAVWFGVQVVVHTLVRRYSGAIPPGFFRHLFRYEFLIVFVVAGSIFILLTRLWLRWKTFTLPVSRTGVVLLFGILLAGVLAGSLFPATWHLHHTYDIRRASEAMAQLPADAVIAGNWAPLATLGTGRRGMTIWPALNSPGALERHRVTHLLLERNRGKELYSNRILLTADPELPQRVRELQTLPMGRFVLDLYEVMPAGER